MKNKITFSSNDSSIKKFSAISFCALSVCLGTTDQQLTPYPKVKNYKDTSVNFNIGFTPTVVSVSSKHKETNELLTLEETSSLEGIIANKEKLFSQSNKKLMGLAKGIKFI